MNPEAIRLSVIIVNYNVRFFLEQALLSVRKALHQIPAEVFVVDNASVDGSASMVRMRFPEVRLIVNEQNLGFARANNQAIQLAQGEFVLLLNPDTVVEEDTFEKCLAFMEQHPECGAIGVKMLDGKGNFLPESKRGFPTPWAAFCKMSGLSRLFPRSPLFNHYYLGHLPQDGVHEIEVLSGAFMFLRRSALQRVNGLDESFFMYGEDIDLSYRLRQAGYKIYYLPSARVIHFKGESTRRSSLNYVRMFYQAMIVFTDKHFSGPGAGIYKFFLWLLIYARAALSIASRLFQRILMPLSDGLTIFGGLWLIKQFWENQVKASEGVKYPWQYEWIVLPLYVAVWVTAIFLSGGYDRGSRFWQVVRGLFWGTLTIAAIYAFLPETLRFSRAMILLGFVWAICATYLIRIIGHLLRTGTFQWSEGQEKKTMIIGSSEEAHRVASLLHLARVRHEWIGYLDPSHNARNDRHYLGHADQIADMTAIYRIDEIIFCARDISSQQIIEWMTQLGPNFEYKIVPQDSTTVIGSNSSQSQGDLYAIDIRLNIDTPYGRRTKRLFDLATSVTLLILLPVVVWFIRNPKRFLQNLAQVLIGQKTWVAYAGPVEQQAPLPALRKGILSPKDGLPRHVDANEATLARLNFLYAKNYNMYEDMVLLWRGFRYLDRSL